MATVDWGPVEQARNTAQGAAATAGEFTTKGITLADELKKALGTRFGESGIPQATAQARSNFMAAPDQVRADLANQVKGGTIFSPSQQQAIMSSKMASALVPLSGANMIQNAAYGGISDMVDAGTRAWQAQTQQKTLEAQLAQANYTNILDELTKKASIKEPEARYKVNVPGMGPMELSASEAISLYGHQKTGAGGGGGDFMTNLKNTIEMLGGAGILSNDDPSKVQSDANMIPSGYGAPLHIPSTGDGSLYADNKTGTLWYYNQGEWWKNEEVQQ